MFVKKLKLSLIIMCVSLVVFLLASCGDESVGSTDSAQSNSAESVEWSAENSDEISGEVLDESSSVEEVTSASSDADTSEETSLDEKETSADDLLGDDDTSPDSGEIDDPVVGLSQFILEIKNKYGDLECVKAYEALGEKINEKYYVRLSGETEISGYIFTFDADVYFDASGEDEKGLADMSMSFFGETETVKFLFLNGNTYLVDDVNKVYCDVPPETEGEGNFNFSFDENSEVKVTSGNELIEGKIYWADRFDIDGNEIALFTKDGEIKFFEIVFVQDESRVEVLFEIEISDDVSGAVFAIPEGYFLVDSENFFDGGFSI